MSENHESARPYRHIGILGAGAWGTALAVVAMQSGRKVTIWARDLSSSKVKHARGSALLHGVEFAAEREKALQAEAVLLAIPAQQLRALLFKLPTELASPLVLCMKGIERGTGKLVTEIAAEVREKAKFAILSGPSFARNVVQGMPTAVTIGAGAALARRLQATLGNSSFRPYASEDMVGVALGGAAKNVYAIACGIVIGLGLGENARAALLARSFAELCRLGRSMGARDETLMGLSGLGDLVLTATSITSRNYALGVSLGKGAELRDLISSAAPLAEGVATAPALAQRAQLLSVELPVAETVSEILSGALAPKDAVPRLMARPFRME
ncbi:MAG TPA: NAD(P)H-dependent glycerol-3-phosphate dehydrogenase [Rhizomicrobium sp.]|jgi:glycerol-3-phosphate dehydrogenase (NAD(P)+)|nr:NAD(P)H-dependent glycerol-3-phosphate dehydrogenase [Rhizomicrobium sp.]